MKPWTLRHWAVVAALLLQLGTATNVPAQEDAAARARQLYEQSRQLYKDYKYEAGLPLAKQALELREQALGREHIDTAAAMVNLANYYSVSHIQADTEILYQRALAIREKVLGPEHPGTASVLNNLALYYGDHQQPKRAEPLYVRALAIREKVLGPEHPDTAATLTNLAVVYDVLGNFELAERMHRRALAINEKAFGPEHPLTGASANNLANIYLATGAYTKAEPLFQRAVRIEERASGPDDPVTADRLNNLGLLYVEMGEYTKAEPFYLRALQIQEKAFGPGNGAVIAPLDNLAALYEATGAHGKADAMYRRSLTILETTLGRDNPELILTLNNFAIVQAQLKDFAQAEQLLLRALGIAEKAFGTNHPDTALCVQNLASVYGDTGSHAKAEARYLQAIALRTRALGADHPLTASSLSGLADVYRDIGAFAKAEPLYRRALAIREKTLGVQHPLTGEVLANLGMLKWAQGEPASALPIMLRAQRVGATNTERFILSGSESRNAAYLSLLTNSVYADVSFSAAKTGPAGAALGLTSVLQYKGRVVDAAADAVGRLRSKLRPKDQALLEELADVANQLSTLTYQSAGQLPRATYRQRLTELTHKQEELETTLARRSSEFRSAIKPATLTALRQALPEDATLIEWFRYEAVNPARSIKNRVTRDARYIAFVLKRRGEVAAIDLGDAAEIESLVREFRQAASAPERSDVDQQAAALSRKLIAPLGTHLHGVRHLILAPDGALNLVPMAALLGRQGRYLAEHFEITYLTSGRDLLRIGTQEPPLSSNPVVMAAPDFGQPERLAAATDRPASQRSAELDRGAGLTFRALPGTVFEATAIQSLLQREPIRMLTGSAASEVNLKQLHGPRILHLATHGFFLDDQQARTVSTTGSGFLAENPLLRSGLALAGANERRSGVSDDGILTALEASRLDLRGTELVVLSACETGVGEVRNGDGISGLRRSLFLAGAQTQVASLWQVSDLPTKELMIDFYRHLVQGEGRSAALRRAQLEMLAQPKRAHPYYWASFVTVGDWKPLAGN